MNETKKARFNFIDAIIILVILAIVSGAALLIFYDSRQSRAIDMGNVDFVIRISGADEDVLDLIKVGESVKDSISGTELGTIRAVRSENSPYYGSIAIPDKNGGYTLPKSEHADKYDIYVTISGFGSAGENGVYTIGSTKILVGSAVYFKIPSFSAVSYITAFTIKPQV